MDERLVTRIQGPSLLSSVHGRIEQVLLTIPSWILRYQSQPEIRSSAAAVRSLLNRLPQSSRFLLVTHTESVDLLTAWLDEFAMTDRGEIIAAPNKMRFGSWPQDGFVVCFDRSNAKHLLEPVPFRTPEDAYVSGMIADSLGAQRNQVPLCFQGGNMLIGDDFWLLGMDSAVQSLKLGLIPASDAGRREALHATFAERVDGTRTLYLVGSRVPVPGFPGDACVRKIALNSHTWDDITYRGNRQGTVQPIFHIDSFLSLAGRDSTGSYVVLVGDPGMAAELLDRESPSHAMQPVFDDIAAQLLLLGFTVVRNPLPLVRHDDELNRVRSWYFASSNNALVEITADRKRVWLPTYCNEEHPELKITDRVNAEIWRGLGFETEALGDFHPFAQNLGAAHCLTKCLARSEVPEVM
jgi:hypothetical protein